MKIDNHELKEISLNKLIFIDTEFTNFSSLDLISVGFFNPLIEHQLYIEINDFPKYNSSDFVIKNIEPFLNFDKFGQNTSLAQKNLNDFFLQHKDFYFISDHQVDFFVIKKFLNQYDKNIFNQLLLTDLNCDLIDFEYYLQEIQIKHNIRVHHAFDDSIANFLALKTVLEKNI